MTDNLIERLEAWANHCVDDGREELGELLDEARAAIERQSVPSDCDVRKIMLAVVPGEDGMGHEVYAKNINEVEAKLFEMGERLEEWELGIRSLAAAPQPQPVQQEPVAVYQYQYQDGSWGDQEKHCHDYNVRHHGMSRVRVLYTSPQAQPLSNDASPISVLLAVEESIKNGECPWQIEQAFDEYEAQRQSAITKGTT